MTRFESATAGFDQYVEQRAGELYWSAWLLTGDHQHAEDLVQTALSKTYQRYATFDSNRHFESYVRTTMYRTFVSWWRRRSWRSELPTEEAPERGAPDEIADPDLHRALANLPRLQRTVLVLRYFDDLPIRQVAEVLRLPEGTVTSHASRGLAALRRSPHLKD
ncbi:SigE family RNA polymerase sigma factor [Tessaracoccus sp. MC1865]|uniref:SigE family RNA polymerase sigma factor n=1 Tax=Tessaracoccus sp. MC1865 TaxID=2760310 RepID=UPI0015FEE20C|nr:SigE family RNA polymerase sigma factor [Tessaracoccus sp. MC1865]MBB1482863.1 SigE family RNA polymerase sigma factor [Tessaracoccus sp. MC1865]QTO37700.1 SigE family RNA polymerase sigma factor [Tessaracoccus sp. MC1865]